MITKDKDGTTVYTSTADGDFITRDEFHLRITQTNEVIDDFRQLKTTFAEKCVKDAAELDITRRQIASDILDLKTIILEVSSDIASVKKTLDTVTANGTHGLENSLRDIYTKIAELHLITKAARTDYQFMKVWSEWKSARLWRRVVFSKKSYALVGAMLFTAHKIQVGSESLLGTIINYIIN